jgi:hypothetical protein
VTSAIVTLVLALAAQSGKAGVVVEGIVRDQTGGVLAGASVELLNAAGDVVQSVEADGVGAFRFPAVVPVVRARARNDDEPHR